MTLVPLHDPLRLATYVPIAAPSIIVFREGDYAVAVDGKTKEVIARSKDHAEVIQAAIDVLDTGTVLLKKGVYDVLSNITPRSGQRLVGEGYGTLLRVPADFTDEIKVIYLYNVEDVVVENLRIDMEKTSPTDAIQHPVELRNAKRCVVRGVWAERAGHTGINLYEGSELNLIVGCVSRRNRHHGIYVDACPRNVIADNILEGNAWSGLAVRSTGSHFNVLRGNVARNNGGNGISIYDNAHRNLVVANSLTLNSHNGIRVYGIAPEENLIIANCIVDNSRASDNAYDGIRIEADRTQVIGNVIKRVSTPSHRYGIAVESGSDNVLKLNYVHGSGGSGPIRDAGSGTVIKNNVGYATENKGTATIPAGSTSVTVSHGLAAAPSKVLVTPIGDPGDRFWVANVDADSFDIVLATAPSEDKSFYWHAEV